MSKCPSCGVNLKNNTFIEGNSLKCKCGAIINNEIKNTKKDTFIETLISKDLTKVVIIGIVFIVLSTGGAMIVSETISLF